MSDMDDSPVTSSNIGDYVTKLEKKLDSSDDEFVAYLENQLESASETATNDEEKEDQKYHIKRNLRSARSRKPRQDLQRLKGKTIFVRNVPLFCNYIDVINYFERFGDIEKARFLSRKNTMYTLCCKIKMMNITAVHEILSTKYHRLLHNHLLIAERYYGRSAHPDVFRKGDYKMKIEGLAPIRGGEGGKWVYTHMERSLTGYRYNGMQLEKGKYIYTGVVEVRFLELLDKLKAWNRAKSLGFKVSTPPRRVTRRHRAL